MKTTPIILALSFAAFGVADVGAQTLAACATRDAIVSRLADKYGETRQSIGLGADNSLVEVFASAETGSWTITVTYPAGQTCLVATGQAFERLTEELAKSLEQDA